MVEPIGSDCWQRYRASLLVRKHQTNPHREKYWEGTDPHSYYMVKVTKVKERLRCCPPLEGTRET